MVQENAVQMQTGLILGDTKHPHLHLALNKNDNGQFLPGFVPQEGSAYMVWAKFSKESSSAHRAHRDVAMGFTQDIRGILTPHSQKSNRDVLPPN